jgi:DNA-binding FadR family transcriptional regulator
LTRCRPPLVDHAAMTSGTRAASEVADRIVADIVTAGWQPGLTLGSEAELLDRYGVSRAILREAIRLLENQEVASTRRGPGGGLVVAEPTMANLLDTVVFYLQRTGVRIEDVFEARIVVEELAVELAASRIGEDDVVTLREISRRDPHGGGNDPRDLHLVLARISGNPALELFVEMLNRLAMLYARTLGPRHVPDGDQVAHAHRRIVAAVVDGDGMLAQRRIRAHLEAEGAFLREHGSSRVRLPPPEPVRSQPGTKRAENLARTIAGAVLAEDLPPGHRIGSEAELVEHYGVSRTVLREAVRILEHHHVARMRRGPGGGLHVIAADPATVTDAVALHLARRGIRPGELAGARLGLELAVVGIAAGRAEQTGAQPGLDRGAGAAGASAAWDLHGQLASLAGNPVLELLVHVLIRLSHLHEAGEEVGASEADVAAHEGIARAVEAGDRALARLRLRRHLGSLLALGE